jgi:hypothetical protein
VQLDTETDDHHIDPEERLGIVMARAVANDVIWTTTFTARHERTGIA